MTGFILGFLCGRGVIMGLLAIGAVMGSPPDYD